MKDLADQGYGHVEERMSRNNRKVSWFVAKASSRGK